MRHCITLAMAIGFAASPVGAAAQSAADRIQEANRLLAEGKADNALNTLRAAVCSEPGDGRARNALGSLLNAQGYYFEALRHSEAAVAAEPDNGRYRYGYGVVLAEHGRFVEAIANFDRALAAHPDLTYALLERGAARLATGDGAGAAADWARAQATAPDLIWTRWYPAMGDFLAGRHAMAADAFHQVANAEPGFAPAPIWARIAARRAGRSAEVPMPSTKDWPSPVLDYFAGKLSADELLAIAAEDEKSGDPRRIGEAHFFMGQWALIDGQREAARDHFRIAIAVAAPRHIWKMAAERELQWLEP